MGSATKEESKMSKDDIKKSLNIIDLNQYLQVCKCEAVFRLLVKKKIITQEELDEAIDLGEQYCSWRYGKERSETMDEFEVIYKVAKRT